MPLPFEFQDIAGDRDVVGPFFKLWVRAHYNAGRDIRIYVRPELEGLA